ncbi:MULTISPECIES: hypothetical protein [unclassified Streptomyces]|uniref:hypothetical protein n=1 Tax=unclassified Streptomyces TaxID=2593676 RepID=UPI001180C351|nr:hypothetical protein [Streptomyces sp. 13-12-16]
MADVVSAFVAAIALVVSVWSVLYAARQTKAAAEQAGISNTVASISANDMALRALREVHLLMLERPGSRAYFYGGKPLPEHQDERDAITTIAELLADVMSSGLLIHAEVPDSKSAHPWSDYCRHTLANSPVMRDLVRAHPAWWPPLPALLPPG